MNEPSRRHIRISDVDRSNAISTLGEHFADGRLTMTEYEERVQQATAAVSEGELEQIFSDLPKLEASRELVPYYSAREIDRLYRSGRNVRLGLLLSTVIGSSALAMLLNSMWEHSAILLLFIPAVFVMLYVMKVGPQNWYDPSQSEAARAPTLPGAEDAAARPAGPVEVRAQAAHPPANQQRDEVRAEAP